MKYTVEEHAAYLIAVATLMMRYSITAQAASEENLVAEKHQIMMQNGVDLKRAEELEDFMLAKNLWLAERR